MKKWVVLLGIVLAVACSVSRTGRVAGPVIPAGTYEDTLRWWYTQQPAQWPAPFVDSGVPWQELGIVPESPLEPYKDSLQHLIDLGKRLFFDPRLSGSGQISCASCHVPDLSWTDGREKSIGHDHQVNQRNAPSLLNVWFYDRLFWDGRSQSLEEQALSPIGSAKEMHGDINSILNRLSAIRGYQPLFDSAFGDPAITSGRLTKALAVFQRTIVSRKSDFDNFLMGKKDALNDEALRGLHLFRTKARCMNCHYGPLLSDNDLHNIGLSYYGRKYEDLGLYNITGLAADVGSFKTPSLRDVVRTRPWMHNGLFDNLEGVINMYNAGMPQLKRKPGQLTDTLFPVTDKLLQPLGLSPQEKQDLIAFLEAITAQPLKVRMPELPL